LPWEDGFCDGLSNCRIFIPLLSREAINHPRKPWQNFTALTAESNCDNVLLEYLLALGLRARGLIEKIYPVMIGDFDEHQRLYENYEIECCHPQFSSESESVEVKAVKEKCASHLSRMALGSPLLANMTVSRIVSQIMDHQGKLIQGSENTAFESILDDCSMMMSPNSKGDENED
jgi:hypothetical protein